MAYPFFSLSKSRRLTPIEVRMGEVVIRVEATAAHGVATIWDADVLIWAASEILSFTRDPSVRDYQCLKAVFDRLQSTTVATTLRQPAESGMHRFCWVNEWKERAAGLGRPLGAELIIPDWLCAAVFNDALIMTIGRAALTGGLERWLYRIVRVQAAHQLRGWCFEVAQRYAKSVSLSPPKRLVFELRDIVLL